MSDTKITEAWRDNAAAWTNAVRQGQIESRELVTNQAIVDAIARRSPRSVLDVGCGEGWLARALAAKAIEVVGIDAVPELIAQARQAGGGRFRVASYQDLAAGELACSVDVVACNFALLGKDSVEGLFAAAPLLLNPGGALVVQTLHPLTACADVPYEDGWREGSWAGCGGGFADPAPWYFRTLASWIGLFVRNGFRLLDVREPMHPVTGRPASVVFIAELDNSHSREGRPSCS